jgi:hypothetical protein
VVKETSGFAETALKIISQIKNLKPSNVDTHDANNEVGKDGRGKRLSERWQAISKG